VRKPNNKNNQKKKKKKREKSRKTNFGAGKSGDGSVFGDERQQIFETQFGPFHRQQFAAQRIVFFAPQRRCKQSRKALDLGALSRHLSRCASNSVNQFSRFCLFLFLLLLLSHLSLSHLSLSHSSHLSLSLSSSYSFSHLSLSSSSYSFSHLSLSHSLSSHLSFLSFTFSQQISRSQRARNFGVHHGGGIERDGGRRRI
jgi:hypothetical protein